MRYLFLVLQEAPAAGEIMNAEGRLHVVSAGDVKQAALVVCPDGKPRRGERVIFLGSTSSLQLKQRSGSLSYGKAVDIEPALRTDMRKELREQHRLVELGGWSRHRAAKRIDELQDYAVRLDYPEGWDEAETL